MKSVKELNVKEMQQTLGGWGWKEVVQNGQTIFSAGQKLGNMVGKIVPLPFG